MNALELNLPVLLLPVKDGATYGRSHAFSSYFAFLDNAVVALAVIMHLLIGILAPAGNNRVGTLVQVAHHSAISFIDRGIGIVFPAYRFKSCSAGREHRNHQEYR